MATEKTGAGKKPTPEARPLTPKEKTYYIVNPAGAVHAVDYEHAKWRLALPGWRSATAAEVAALNAAGGNQVHDRPIAPPWTPEPAEMAEPGEEAGEK